MTPAIGRLFGRPGRSLTRRLIWLAAAWIAVALAATAILLTSVFRDASFRRLDRVLQNTINDLIVATRVVDGDLVTPQLTSDERTLEILSGKYWIVAEEGDDGGVRITERSQSIWDANLALPADVADRAREPMGELVRYNRVGPAREPLRMVARMVQIPGRQKPVILIAAIDRSSIEADTRAFATVTLVALVVLGLGLLAAVFTQVRIGLRPIYALSREVADVRKGKSARITGGYPSEIAGLVDQMNKLFDHNQEVVERQRTHVGNLAHALKTPLSVMLNESQMAGGPLSDTVRRQSELMQAQVDHHLRRARAAARAQGLGERTPVEAVLDEMAVMFERVHQAKGVEIDWRSPDDLTFRGERQDLQEIVGNLLDNACKWCRRKVRVSAGPNGLGQLVMVIEDDGPGLPADRRDEVLKRGARLDEEAPGSGLGLSIVDELVRAYSGRITLTESDLGGLKAVVELPAAEA